MPHLHHFSLKIAYFLFGLLLFFLFRLSLCLYFFFWGGGGGGEGEGGGGKVDEVSVFVSGKFGF